MCGIVGAISERNVVPILIEGLKRLEYRGYDSAGLAVLTENNQLHLVKSVGKVAELTKKASQENLFAPLGIAHTRWATHGAPSEENAHPHISGDIAIVHNGIIENDMELRQFLQEQGYVFSSDTDSEVIAHLLHHLYQQYGDFAKAWQEMAKRLKGAFAIAAISSRLPQEIWCLRHGSSLVLGLGVLESFVASDVAALVPLTQEVIYLEDGDSACLTKETVTIWNGAGEQVQRPVTIAGIHAADLSLGHFRHFMHKEIHEQPEAVADTLAALLNPSKQEICIPFLDQLAKITRVQTLACGTSHHAALVARYWIEALAGIPVATEVASEFRYRQAYLDDSTLLIAISQSGETADTLAALKTAKEKSNGLSLAICNVPQSALVREASLHLLTDAGIEVGVASTKAFTTQLCVLLVLAAAIAKAKGRLDEETEKALLSELLLLPEKLQEALKSETLVAQWAHSIANFSHALYLGRGVQYPIALEGALKLKEIAYIHAEGYPGGELKHGPLALVTRDMPVIALLPDPPLYEKMRANIEEVRARDGLLYLIGAQTEKLAAVVKDILPLPQAQWTRPIIDTIPLQLLAYHAAVFKGTDVDKPRNLAKAVTVE